MLELIAELVKLLVEGIRAGEKASDDAASREQEIVALRLAERRIQTEIAKRTLPP